MPEYHPSEHPGLLQADTPDDLGARATLLVDKHRQYIIDFGNVRACQNSSSDTAAAGTGTRCAAEWHGR
jgi:hypothetical protein